MASSSQQSKKHNNIATVIAGVFFLLIALVLFYVTYSLRSEAQGREMKITLAELYTGTATHGDYLTIQDTGAVISSAADINDQYGMPVGRAFILNGIPNYIFMVGITDQFQDTSGKELIAIQPGTLIPGAFYARVNTETELPPMGAEDFAIQNGLSTGMPFYLVQVGVTKSDTSVPFYLTLGFGALALFFSAGSWWSLARKKP
jgi:hypothetical protein